MGIEIPGGYSKRKAYLQGARSYLFNSSGISNEIQNIKQFGGELLEYNLSLVGRYFRKFETNKAIIAAFLYRQRGKNARRLIHSGMVGLASLGVMIAPVLAEEFPSSNTDPWQLPPTNFVISATTYGVDITTEVSAKPRDKITEYIVQEGDTVSSIAKKFDISEDTIYWQNGLSKNSKIRVGQVLKILPVTGVSHKVQKGDTVYSIAKKYDTSAQSIVDFPFNTFVNDETFELAVGQIIIVPDGVMPQDAGPVSPRVRQLTPDAGTVVASGNFIWPASGVITQRFAWYHRGIDIANPSAPDILAADSGVVVLAGWDGSGYGNRVVIDHGNGRKTLYAHLSRLYVVAGQTVSRGAAIGKMGSTGRSTGTHLHFEIYTAAGKINPLSELR
jgi:LysM repeat protein